MKATPSAATDLASPTSPAWERSASPPAHHPYRARRARETGVRLGRLAAVLAGLAIITLVTLWWVSHAEVTMDSRHQYDLFTVQPRDLPVTVTERGTLESQKTVEIKCEVDDVPGDWIDGTPILWIIENGSVVAPGDLVVQLDDAPHRERVDKETLETIYAQGQFIARTLDVARRKISNAVLKANAELAAQMAGLRLGQFEDEQGGTFQLQLQGVELAIEQQDEQRRIDSRNLSGTQYLFELGYKSKGDLAQAQLQALRSDTAVRREIARRRELLVYEHTRSRLQLEGALHSAERALRQVVKNNEAALAQNEVWLKMAEMGKHWHDGRLAYYRAQLEKCKVYAPHRGMVAYYVDANRWGGSSTISSGTTLWRGQPIMSIPDLTCMQVRTAVHETVVDRVKPGMQATVRLDAFPNRTYAATVHAVDVLPDPGGWLSSDTKTYATIVTIDEEVEKIKPGMTAVVKINIEQLTDVVSIPIQAIVQEGDTSWCYVFEQDQPRKCCVTLGAMNDQFVEIRAGLAAGDRIVLNPSAVVTLESNQRLPLAPDRKNPDDFWLH